ncbi:MAG TPA: hypothetical protein VN858_04810 [Casimicrobiaceae bacterium]|nr:hypothetical protein [Casimicrobiaceae bacterium]
MERQLRILGEYVAHLIVGAIMFAALLAFGVGLNLLVQSAESLINRRNPSSAMPYSCA